MMEPKLEGIDHIHVYVHDRNAAASWYQEKLDLQPVERLVDWATPGGPLTVGNADDSVHLALFERKDWQGSTAIAFKCSSDDFLRWKTRLERGGLSLRITDHTLAYSLYFYDPWDNMHEITTYEHEPVRATLGS